MSLQRNPFFPKNFLTIGDWTARVREKSNNNYYKIISTTQWCYQVLSDDYVCCMITRRCSEGCTHVQNVINFKALRFWWSIKEHALILLFVDLVRGSQRVIHYVDQVWLLLICLYYSSFISKTKTRKVFRDYFAQYHNTDCMSQYKAGSFTSTWWQCHGKNKKEESKKHLLGFSSFPHFHCEIPTIILPLCVKSVCSTGLKKLGYFWKLPLYSKCTK